MCFSIIAVKVQLDKTQNKLERWLLVSGSYNFKKLRIHLGAELYAALIPLMLASIDLSFGLSDHKVQNRNVLVLR